MEIKKTSTDGTLQLHGSNLNLVDITFLTNVKIHLVKWQQVCELMLRHQTPYQFKIILISWFI